MPLPAHITLPSALAAPSPGRLSRPYLESLYELDQCERVLPAVVQEAFRVSPRRLRHDVPLSVTH